jgi:hypothetical protein
VNSKFEGEKKGFDERKWSSSHGSALGSLISRNFVFFFFTDRRCLFLCSSRSMLLHFAAFHWIISALNPLAVFPQSDAFLEVCLLQVLFEFSALSFLLIQWSYAMRLLKIAMERTHLGFGTLAQWVLIFVSNISRRGFDLSLVPYTILKVKL